MPGQSIIETKVTPVNLNAKAGNGTVATGSYTLLVPANPKRRWFAVTVPTTGQETLIVLPRSGDLVEFGQLYLPPGGSLVLSMSGDMPWQGIVLATGLTANSYVYWTEVEDYP